MAKTARIETVAFTIEEGEVTREPAGSRTLLRFAAPAKRHLDGGFEVNNVNALLFDRDGRFIARRGSERARTVLGNRAAWVHEIPVDQLALATRVSYEIEHRFDLRRKVLATELPTLPAESDGSDYWRWLTFDPRLLEDRTTRFDIALWARNSELVITFGQIPKFATDSFRCEYELDLLDGDGLLVANRTFSGGLNYGRPNFDDTSISMERRLMRTLRFFELRARTEARAIAEIAVDLLP